MAMLRLGRTRSQAALHCSFDRRDSRRIRRDRPSVGQQQQQQQQRMARLRGKGGESTETRERQSDRTEIAERRLRVCMRLQLRSVSTLLLLRPQFRSVASHALLVFAFGFACCPRFPAAQNGFQYERFPMSPSQPAAVRLRRRASASPKSPPPHRSHRLACSVSLF